jgi:hypothetical protein
MALLTPFLKLCWGQLAEVSRARLKRCHQNRDLIPRGYLTGAAELLQWPALKDDVVLLRNGAVKVCVVHTRDGHPSSQT